jgi:hypothetical protein
MAGCHVRNGPCDKGHVYCICSIAKLLPHHVMHETQEMELLPCTSSNTTEAMNAEHASNYKCQVSTLFLGNQRRAAGRAVA